MSLAGLRRMYATGADHACTLGVSVRTGRALAELKLLLEGGQHRVLQGVQPPLVGELGPLDLLGVVWGHERAREAADDDALERGRERQRCLC